ncbi:MAG: hypothetical protein JXQ23_06680 [Clostridia bacterium]|nr:hypothetical protein [Clostridia bacterium]
MENTDALFSGFNSFRELHGIKEITLNEFCFTAIAFKGDNTKTMDIIISYMAVFAILRHFSYFSFAKPSRNDI